MLCCYGNIHWDSYIDPELVTCKTQLAEAHVRIGEYDKAEEICKEAIKIESGRADTWYSLGYIYYKQQKYDEAIEANKESLEFGSEENYVNSYYIGKAYLYKGEFENAIESFKEALEFNPEYADAWNDLGSAYSEVGNYEDSEKAHKRALEVSPMDANIWTRLVLLYVNDQKKPDKAMDICNKILEVNPEDAKGWAYKGATHFNKKEIDEAFAAINRSLEIDPKLEGAWGQLGRIYARKGENDKALEAYEKALEIDPKFKEVIKLREKLLESMKAAEKKTPRSWE
jgi:tetratricopeptide (TPR) repeat protein